MAIKKKYLNQNVLGELWAASTLCRRVTTTSHFSKTKGVNRFRSKCAFDKMEFRAILTTEDIKLASKIGPV